ncbi:hypothetical protein GIB67_037562 [Kingdonia uniflora]|uniref:Uncharacterized protein n=1 Tax=Kingdonia uniflora TaxID=39325 RepID=A0A7J7P6Y9_9MAGN|nr:hypothetical protein GIB67_037562 [Kingdonia uniflora]
MDRRLESKETSSDFEEVEAARKELQSIRDEGFQFMASMDIIRQELKHVSEETARLKSIEEKANPTVQNLNSKILRATSKLEALSIAEENAKEIVSNLSSTLQQLTTEGEAAKKQRELISEEAENIRAETLKIESETDLAEAKLIVAMKDLEEVKSSETFALADLKNLSEKTMRDRASASQHSSSITISHFEYKYLMGRAEEVEKIADKKVAAAQAWIEALKASEKEILMKTDIAHREMRELKVVEVVEGSENMQLSLALPRKSMKDNGNSTPMRRGKPRRPSSPGSRRTSRSGSIMIKRRTKVMPNLGNLFGSKRTGECA